MSLTPFPENVFHRCRGSREQRKLKPYPSLTAAAKVRGTSLFTDADVQVYVDAELACTVGRQANFEALVERLLLEEDIDSRVYGDGR